MQVMVVTPDNISLLEQSHTRIQVIAAKRKKHLKPNNLEVLYLLASLKDQVEPPDPEKYEKAIKQLQK